MLFAYYWLYVERKALKKLIMSDNLKKIKANLMKAYCRTNGIFWKFIIEQSPCWGGFYQHLAASVKTS